jgi:hypothetical protein
MLVATIDIDITWMQGMQEQRAGKEQVMGNYQIVTAY